MIFFLKLLTNNTKLIEKATKFSTDDDYLILDTEIWYWVQNAFSTWRLDWINWIVHFLFEIMDLSPKHQPLQCFVKYHNTATCICVCICRCIRCFAKKKIFLFWSEISYPDGSNAQFKLLNIFSCQNFMGY
jgi:hypothetical protein